MKNLLVLFQMGSEMRQFSHSGFINEMLESGWEVTVATRFQEKDFSHQLDQRVNLVRIPKAKPDFWYEQAAVALDRAQELKRRKKGLTTWSYGGSAPRNWRQRIRLSGQKLASQILSVSPFIYRLVQNWEARRIASRGRETFAEFLMDLKPDAIVASVPRMNYQSHLLAEAARQGCRRYLFFHTNKDIVASSRIDHSFTAIGVWNDWMKENLLIQNPEVERDSVNISGCAHFDCISSSEVANGAGEFRKKLGLKESEQIVLYTAAGPGVLPKEERFIDVVVDAMEILPGDSVRLVVRLNPMDDSDRIEKYLREHHPTAIVMRPDWYYSRSVNLCYQQKTDVVTWNELLNYSSVCVNIPSTVTLECALEGLPVINIGFDLPGPRPRPGSVRAFWDVDYYENSRKSGAALLCEDPARLTPMLADCLTNKRLLEEGQILLINTELGGILPPRAHKIYRELIDDEVAAH